jgi:hypothetical protein
MKLKLKGRRFDTTEEIQFESQTVIYTLTESDFQETFQKCRRLWVYMREGTTSTVMAADGPYDEFYVFAASVRNVLDTTAHRFISQ